MLVRGVKCIGFRSLSCCYEMRLSKAGIAQHRRHHPVHRDRHGHDAEEWSQLIAALRNGI